MKLFLLQIILVILFITELKAQLVINAGNDTVVCWGAPVNLGGNPTASGGTLPYTYQWAPISGISSTYANPLIYSTVTTVYQLTVVDATGDSVLSSVTIITDRFQASGIATSPPCNGGHNGSIDASSSFFTGSYYPPFSYLWSTGDTTSQLQNLYQGNYQVTAIDNLGCSSNHTFSLITPQAIWAASVVTNESLLGGCDGSIALTTQGGYPPYTYDWGSGPSTQNPDSLCAGVYWITISDVYGCLAFTSDTVLGQCCYNIVQGYIFSDADSNCTNDVGELPLGGVYVIATNGSNDYYGYSNSSGAYNIRIPFPGNFSVTAVNNNWNSNCANAFICGAQNISFTGLDDTTDLSFGIGISSGFDITLHPGWTSASPGFTKKYWVLYEQENLPGYTGAATIVFKYDSILQFVSSTQGGVNDAFAKTVTWNVDSVPYYIWNWSSKPEAIFNVSASTPTGYQLMQEFTITPIVGDCDYLDNHFFYVQPVSGSMDPNSKEVYPTGNIYEEDSVLTYTIHFQNTGNDTTMFITVKDTLSQYLNPVSVVNVASSHNYSSFDVSENGILTWEFNPIFLVDSGTNESASKGFIMFKIKRKSNLPLNTQISNRASIYFDYNEPVVTNNTINTVSTITAIPKIDSLKEKSMYIFPNPANTQLFIETDGVTVEQLNIYNTSGILVSQTKQPQNKSIDISQLATGVYIAEIKTKELSVKRRWVKM